MCRRRCRGAGHSHWPHLDGPSPSKSAIAICRKQPARRHLLVARAKTDSLRRQRSLVSANYLPPAATAMTWMRADSACGGKRIVIVSPAATVQKSPALRCSFFPAISVSTFPDLSCAI